MNTTGSTEGQVSMENALDERYVLFPCQLYLTDACCVKIKQLSSCSSAEIPGSHHEGNDSGTVEWYISYVFALVCWCEE